MKARAWAAVDPLGPSPCGQSIRGSRAIRRRAAPWADQTLTCPIAFSRALKRGRPSAAFGRRSRAPRRARKRSAHSMLRHTPPLACLAGVIFAVLAFSDLNAKTEIIGAATEAMPAGNPLMLGANPFWAGLRSLIAQEPGPPSMNEINTKLAITLRPSAQGTLQAFSPKGFFRVGSSQTDDLWILGAAPIDAPGAIENGLTFGLSDPRCLSVKILSADLLALGFAEMWIRRPYDASTSFVPAIHEPRLHPQIAYTKGRKTVSVTLDYGGSCIVSFRLPSYTFIDED